MENNDRRQRTNPSGYATQQGLLQTSAQYPVVSAPDRFRQAPLAAPAPTSAPPAAGGRAGSGYGYAYAEGSQFVGSAIQQSYGTQQYATEQQQRGPQQQEYSTYAGSVLYNVQGQQSSAHSPQSSYDPVQRYPPGQTPAIEVLGTGFPVQPVAQSYYGVHGEGPTSAPAATMTATVPSQYPPMGYTTQQSPVGRETLASSYSQPGMTDPSQHATANPTYSAQTGNYGGEQQGNEYETHFNSYTAELKRTFEFTRDSRLAEAAQQLFDLSNWLTHMAELTIGLVRDDENYYAQRLKMWEEFNNCWLVTLQRQKAMMHDMINSGQRPQPPQSLIDPDFLEKLGTQLVKNCDNMEKHGLVDYQMGVWEEEIIAMLTVCLDLWEEAGVAPPSASASQRAPSASTSRRR
ncbi:hypothetical protein BCR34DRAFT_480416 [Clohesyomyces aquaticus]|uniref:Uncharacterized protein n=1 Tax=Clohesyomyces aquaticus TaxID=1231657 RepID=A0A1Y1ZUF8_9PLEO|nr:hypothetical protein BCR34DRAFT_480416 [Clohesyomyces aquaticus]